MEVARIKNNTVKNLSVFPNPATNKLTINNKNISDQANVKIYSIGGELVKFTKNIYNQIDVLDIEPGHYFIIIQTNNEIYKAPFIKN